MTRTQLIPPLSCCDQMGLTRLGRDERYWVQLASSSKRRMRFRHWERTQVRRLCAGGGDIVEGRRRQLPPSCQPRRGRGWTRVYSRGMQPGSRPLPDSRPTPGVPEPGRGARTSRAQRRRLPGFPESSDSRVTAPPACAPGPAYKPAFRGSLRFSFFFLLSLFSPSPDKGRFAKDAVPGGGGARSATEDGHQGCPSRSAAL